MIKTSIKQVLKMIIDKTNDIISLIKEKQPYLFSYDIVDLIDFYNMECAIPQNDDGKHSAALEIAHHLKIDLFRVHENKTLSFNDEKRKNFYRNGRVIYGTLTGKNVVFTGRGPFVRGELMSLARKAGAEISSTVSTRTNLLVVGDKPGSKLTRAKRLNMDIISVEGFFDIIEGRYEKHKEEKRIEDLIKLFGGTIFNNYRNKNVTLLIEDKNLHEILKEVFEGSEVNIIEEYDKEKTDILIYQLYKEESDVIFEAEDNNVQVMSLGEFNRNLLLMNDEPISFFR